MSTCILLGIGRFTLPVAHGQGDVERLKPLPKALHQRALLASSAQECRAISGGVRRIHWLHGCACEDQAQLHQPDVLVEFVPVVHLVEFVMHYTLWLAHLWTRRSKEWLITTSIVHMDNSVRTNCTQ